MTQVHMDIAEKLGRSMVSLQWTDYWKNWALCMMVVYQLGMGIMFFVGWFRKVVGKTKVK